MTLVAAEELPGRSLARAQPLTPSSAGGALGPRAQAVSRASLLALTVYRQSLLLSYASLPAGLPAFELAQVGAQAAAGTLRRSSRRVLVPPFEPAQEELSAPAVSDEAASPLLASAFSVGQTEATADAETVSFMQSVGMRDAVAAAAPAPQARVAKSPAGGRPLRAPRRPSRRTCGPFCFLCWPCPSCAASDESQDPPLLPLFRQRIAAGLTRRLRDID